MEKRFLLIGSAAKHLKRWFHYVTPILNDNIVIDIFVTSKENNGDVFEGADNVFYTQKIPFYLKPLLNVPKIRALIWKKEQMHTFKKIMQTNNYYAINIHQVFLPTFQYAKYAKQRGVKVILTPWGSDVLRCHKSKINRMKRFFSLADIVTYNLERFAEKYTKLYDVDTSKMVYAGFGSEIFDLIPLYKGKVSKKEICDALNIPYACYFITCGYMAGKAQKHKQMIKSIGENINILPEDTILLFPFIYGDGKNNSYMNELKELCNGYKLRCHFITNYLSNKEMALFRLLPDLFIHIQPTDAANASLAEYLLADVQVVNGKWLDYPHLEEDGVPYHTCESLDSLTLLLNDFFRGKLPNKGLSDVARCKLMKGAWTNQKVFWKVLIEEI